MAGKSSTRIPGALVLVLLAIPAFASLYVGRYWIAALLTLIGLAVVFDVAWLKRKSNSR